MNNDSLGELMKGMARIEERLEGHIAHEEKELQYLGKRVEEMHTAFTAAKGMGKMLVAVVAGLSALGGAVAWIMDHVHWK